MTYSESPFSQLSDELWHVFGGRRRFPTNRGWGDGDSGDCDLYWPAENGQIATTQSADGCTYLPM